ncbi:MAG: NUDIX domain-containing protein [Succinivibrio sp.]|nr:NUDIX domain-containing protein [Succinivibrio sp.]
MSANERVDIVNEKDEVIDTVPRHVMRERHLAHRASYMAVRRGDGRYLIEIRTLTKDYAPGKLDACVGGVMQHAEIPSESARRELMEEVGIDAAKAGNAIADLGKLRIPYQDGVHFLYGYLYLVTSDQLTVRQREEVSGVMFLTEGEVNKLFSQCSYDSVIAFKEILERARERGLL